MILPREASFLRTGVRFFKVGKVRTVAWDSNLDFFGDFLMVVQIITFESVRTLLFRGILSLLSKIILVGLQPFMCRTVRRGLSFRIVLIPTMTPST